VVSNEERRRRRKVKRQERQTAEDFGGRVTPASGALWGAKGDVATSMEMVENKRTDGTQITLKRDWLDKIFSEAVAAGKVPYLEIEIGGRSYLLMTKADGLDLRDRAREE